MHSTRDDPKGVTSHGFTVSRIAQSAPPSGELASLGAMRLTDWRKRRVSGRKARPRDASAPPMSSRDFAKG